MVVPLVNHVVAVVVVTIVNHVVTAPVAPPVKYVLLELAVHQHLVLASAAGLILAELLAASVPNLPRVLLIQQLEGLENALSLI